MIRVMQVTSDERSHKAVKRILTQKQFAERIGKTVRHVQRLFAEGEGPPVVHTGKRSVGITEEDSDAWIAARRVVPPGWQDGDCSIVSTPPASAGGFSVKPPQPVAYRLKASSQPQRPRSASGEISGNPDHSCRKARR